MVVYTNQYFVRVLCRCLRIVNSVLKEAEVDVAEVDEVIMVGGSTRIPILRSKISECFNDKVCAFALLMTKVQSSHRC